MRLDLSADAVLSTTRAVRKRLDLERPVEMDTVRECLELAIQAPTGSNAQRWQFVVVTDADKRARIGELYRSAFEAYRKMPVSARAFAKGGSGADRALQERVLDSVAYLAQNLHRVPVHLIPCIQGRSDGIPPSSVTNLAQASVYGSILPATWSFMLAARERGLGTAWTTLHLSHEKEIAELLGIPYDEVMQVALIPCAHTQGTDFKPARRLPLDDLLHVNEW